MNEENNQKMFYAYLQDLEQTFQDFMQSYEDMNIKLYYLGKFSAVQQIIDGYIKLYPNVVEKE
jgi:hypothetical protein